MSKDNEMTTEPMGRDEAVISEAAMAALCSYQQADADGVMVLVSREALTHAIAALRGGGEVAKPRVGERLACVVFGTEMLEALHKDGYGVETTGSFREHTSAFIRKHVRENFDTHPLPAVDKVRGMGVMFGRMDSADFEADTVTFAMEPGYYAAAGRYRIERVDAAMLQASQGGG
ncbi:hypothetical protein [Arenimonas alkanexedens]